MKRDKPSAGQSAGRYRDEEKTYKRWIDLIKNDMVTFE